MIGSIAGIITCVVGTAYAYKNNACLRRELDAVVDWIDDGLDYIFGTDAPKGKKDEEKIELAEDSEKPSCDSAEKPSFDPAESVTEDKPKGSETIS